MRARLPDRRPADTIKIRSVHQSRTLHLTLGYYPDTSRVGELFVHGAKVGSHMDAMLSEFATLLSIALQEGMELKTFAANVQREPDGRPSSVFGEIIDAILAEVSVDA